MRANGKWYECPMCKKEVYRTPGQMKKSKIAYCSIECFKKVSRPRMAEMNKDLNPNRMTEETKNKIRESRLTEPSERKTYTKRFGRHEHRIVAEEKIGRPLKPGEVVHHIDGNKQNNKPENLMVFKNQSEHVRWHNAHDPKWGCKKDEIQAA